MKKMKNKNPVTKSLAQINRLIDSAIYCTQAIEETSGRCPECYQSGKIVQYKVKTKGKAGSLMKFSCSHKHNWRVTLFPLGQNTFEGSFRYKGQTYDLLAASPKTAEVTTP